jgi:hypothetical protein
VVSKTTEPPAFPFQIAVSKTPIRKPFWVASADSGLLADRLEI